MEFDLAFFSESTPPSLDVDPFLPAVNESTEDSLGNEVVLALLFFTESFSSPECDSTELVFKESLEHANDSETSVMTASFSSLIKSIVTWLLRDIFELAWVVMRYEDFLSGITLLLEPNW